jgi:transposase
MPKKYVVDLSAEERAELQGLLNKGKLAVRKLKRAQILLLADEDRSDEAIAAALHVGTATVARTRERFVSGGLALALNERPRPGGQPKLTPGQQAHLVALACSAPPRGRRHWTLQLLADRLVELGVVESIADETVRRVLKKGAANPG